MEGACCDSQQLGNWWPAKDKVEGPKLFSFSCTSHRGAVRGRQPAPPGSQPAWLLPLCQDHAEGSKNQTLDAKKSRERSKEMSQMLTAFMQGGQREEAARWHITASSYSTAPRAALFQGLLCATAMSRS